MAGAGLVTATRPAGYAGSGDHGRPERWLFVIIPKGFFPLQDTGRLIGSMQADQSTSFQAMQQKLDQMVAIVRHDPAVASVVGFTGQGSGGAGGQSNTGSVFIALKPIAQRATSMR